MTTHKIVTPALYLIPVLLGDAPLDEAIPTYNVEVVSQLKHFIVENVRSARRFLKKCNRDIDIDTLTFYELNKQTDPTRINDYLLPMNWREYRGDLEAGCPAVADPGLMWCNCPTKGYKVSPCWPLLHPDGFNGVRF